jgi:dye decolorizing peroxidase
LTGEELSHPDRNGLSRRRLLLGGAAAGIGAATAIGADYVINRTSATHTKEDTTTHGIQTVPFYGTHQAGIATEPQAHSSFVAFDLLPHTDRDALRRMMQILTDDAARLTQGHAALADSEPELATLPAHLTITFGFGPELVNRAVGPAARPPWLGTLPAFTIDQLEPIWNDGELFLQIASDDPVAIAHAQRMLLKDTRSFATIRWTQTGFRNAHGSQKPGTTMRNLFGQIDGTVNPVPGTKDFDQLVWNTDGWLAGGTSVVIRRIRMNLDKWDRLDRSGREQSVGRYLSNGAPLTGTDEHDEPDFAAITKIGLPVIPEFSHIRRARSDNTAERIYRRGYNYDAPPTTAENSNSGLLFVSYQADVTKQFVPLQQRLEKLDLLNEWTTPIGSAVFAIPPGCHEGGFIGETLLS